MKQQDITDYFKQHFKEFSDRELQQMARAYYEDKGFVDRSSLESDVKDLQKGIPIQYVTGYEFFYDRKFIVTVDVLIPRPETEELVHWIIQDEGERIEVRDARSANPLGKHNTRDVFENFSCVDIGTGSGIIPVILKSKFPNWNVSALDVSREALEVATLNAKEYDLEIDLHELDVLNNALPSASLYDIIVSNPPYITHEESSIMKDKVLDHEPHIALFAENAQDFYQRICELSKSHLKKDGAVYVELNENYADETKLVFERYFTEVKIKLDLQGKKRMLRARHLLS